MFYRLVVLRASQFFAGTEKFQTALFGVFGFGWLVGLDRFHPRKQPLINPITGVALAVDERTVLVVLVFWWCGCGRAGGFDEGV